MDVVAKSASNGAADTLDGLSVLKRVRNVGLAPDTTTYNSLLEVYAHCASRGKATLSEALKILRSMRADGVCRDAVTYNTLMDLLAKETHSRYAPCLVSPPLVRRFPSLSGCVVGTRCHAPPAPS